MSRRLMGAATAAVVFSSLIANIAPAATMNYGDFAGASVVYNDVTEATPEPGLLFTAPTVVGDTLEFDPVNFFSEVDPGDGSNIVDSQIFTVVEALPGFFIDNIMISEQGDFTLVGLPDAFAHASVGAAFFFEVLGVDGTLVGDGPIGFANMQFTTGGGPNGGEYTLPADGGTAVPWSGSVFLDIQAAMDASPYAGQRATSVRLTFDNTLATAAGADASSFIKKKQIGGIIIQTNIPEPSTIVLLGCLAAGSAGMVLMRRRLG